jgi:hypothetical protein
MTAMRRRGEPNNASSFYLSSIAAKNSSVWRKIEGTGMQKKTFVAGMEEKIRLYVMIINYGEEIF